MVEPQNAVGEEAAWKGFQKKHQCMLGNGHSKTSEELNYISAEDISPNSITKDLWVHVVWGFCFAHVHFLAFSA